MCVYLFAADLLLEYDGIVFPSPAFAFKHESRVHCREHHRVLTGTKGIYSASKNFQTLIYFHPLPLASLPLLPPTPRLILSSCFFSLVLECKAGVALRHFSFSELCFELTLCTDSTCLPQSLFVLVAFCCVTPTRYYCDLMTGKK